VLKHEGSSEAALFSRITADTPHEVLKFTIGTVMVDIALRMEKVDIREEFARVAKHVAYAANRLIEIADVLPDAPHSLGAGKRLSEWFAKPREPV
jgi:hypothetical protein